MYKFIALFLLWQSYNFSLVALNWTQEMCDEFVKLVDDTSSLRGEQLEFQLSEDLRKALFISKGKPRLELRKFQQIDGTVSCRLTEKNTVAFTRSSVLRFCQFLEACRLNDKVIWPTLDASAPKVIKSAHSIKQQIIKIDIGDKVSGEVDNSCNRNALHSFSCLPEKSQISCLDNDIYILSSTMIQSFDGLTLKQVGQSFVPLKHFLPMARGHFISTAEFNGQWWITLHKPSGSMTSTPIKDPAELLYIIDGRWVIRNDEASRNPVIIALSAVTDTIAAILTDRGIFLCDIDVPDQAPILLLNIHELCSDFTCKKSSDDLHFFIVNSNENKIEEISFNPTMEWTLRQHVLTHDIASLQYDKKNDCLLIADKRGQIRVYSCQQEQLELVHECLPINGLRSWSINEDSSIYCLRDC